MPAASDADLLQAAVDNLKVQLSAEEEMDFTEQLHVMQEQVRKSNGTDEETLFSLNILMVKAGKKKQLEEALRSLEHLSFSIVQRVSEDCAQRLGFPRASGTVAEGKEQDQHLLQCLYFIALAQYKLKQYEEAIECCNKILKVSPHMSQTIALRALSEQDSNKITVADVALAAGALVGGLLLARATVRSSRS
eukprot:TRINITY_DN19529_c0_g1_i1.p1 TRINITY_DN19529_c0_g1~~TRINITY_DN19529_c0_g1_i1.p1  ORF type:complete len:192 (+),score=88.65 TRINITY_DN19529_c0_g1_i1:35-610(+)